jgi:hypothetical protein
MEETRMACDQQQYSALHPYIERIFLLLRLLSSPQYVHFVSSEPTAVALKPNQLS